MAQLFKKNILIEKLENFEIPNFEEKIKNIESWNNLYKSGKLHEKKEVSIGGEYASHILGTVLGYSDFVENNEEWNRQNEPGNPTGGQSADFGLGFFKSSKDFSKNLVKVVVEVKDTKTSLDKPQQRAGNLTPIQQAFKYKPYFNECDFIIVSNFYETRLYIDSYYDYESFTLTDLVDHKNNYFNFRKFYYLLNKDNLITKKGDSNTKSLLSLIRIQEKEITKQFYKEYTVLRRELFKDIVANNQVKKTELDFVLSKTQKIIDRIIFIHFCEDLDLLPNGKLKENILRAEEIGFIPWEMLKKFFEFVNSGSEKLGIPEGYNGGLFKEDKYLNNLKVGDKICKKFVDMGEYDFADDLSVNILGHIFEQSISDIEELKDKINKQEEATLSKRKKDGVFYTPEYIVDYIVKNSVGKKIDEWEDELKQKHKLKEDITDKNYTKRAVLVYEELQTKVHSIKVLDPACGSGAFLVKVFDFLLDKNKEISKKLEDLGINQGLFSSESYFKTILQNNIYGVDLNEESVEITKLSLWLKTAQKGKKLANLDSNIKCGNSLIDDKEIVGDKAFVWETEFKEIFVEGGFDVVVGNPPYIKEFVNKNAFNGLKNSKYYQGKMDLWQFFACKGIDWLNKDGIISYIAPNNWITNAGATIMRNKVLSETEILEFIDFGDYKVFEDAGIQTMIFIIKKGVIDYSNKAIKYSKIIDKNILDSDIENYINSKVKNQNFISYNSNISKDDDKISFQNKENKIILDKIFSNKNFELESSEVAQGIVGAPDNAYLIDNIDIFGEDEKVYIKKFYTNTGKYAKGLSDKYIIYLTNNNFKGKNIEDYKNIYNHFKPLIETLKEARIKLKTPNKPYYYLHRERDEKFFKKGGKIISQTMTLKPSFFYTEDEYYNSRALNNIITDRINLKYLTTILNSSISYFWLKYRGKLTGDLIQIDKGPLLSIPIKNISLSEQKPFIEKADFMLDKNKELQEKVNKFLKRLNSSFEIDKLTNKLKDFYEFEFSDFIKELKKKKIEISLKDQDEWEEYFDSYKKEILELESEIDACDKEIDEMVFELYGLNEEERDVVLESN